MTTPIWITNHKCSLCMGEVLLRVYYVLCVVLL